MDEKTKRQNFIDLAYKNFDSEDYFITATYDSEHIPQNSGDDINDVRNYMKRIAHRCKKLGLPSPKYLGAIDPWYLHHHILVSCKLSRDELASLWNLGITKITTENDVLAVANHIVSLHMGCSCARYIHSRM